MHQTIIQLFLLVCQRLLPSVETQDKLYSLATTFVPGLDILLIQLGGGGGEGLPVAHTPRNKAHIKGMGWGWGVLKLHFLSLCANPSACVFRCSWIGMISILICWRLWHSDLFSLLGFEC